MDVEIYTTSHVISGSVDPGSHGLFSFMNRPTESYIEISEAELRPLHQVTQEGDKTDRLWMVKGEVVAVLVQSRGGLGPASVMRSGYTKPFPHRVRVLAGGYEMRGMMQAGGRFEFGAIMFEGASPFLPLFDAGLMALLFPKARAQAPALLFNRAKVQAIAVLRDGG